MLFPRGRSQLSLARSESDLATSPLKVSPLCVAGVLLGQQWLPGPRAHQGRLWCLPPGAQARVRQGPRDRAGGVMTGLYGLYGLHVTVSSCRGLLIDTKNLRLTYYHLRGGGGVVGTPLWKSSELSRAPTSRSALRSLVLLATAPQAPPPKLRPGESTPSSVTEHPGDSSVVANGG
jgi:hypothetical protein